MNNKIQMYLLMLHQNGILAKHLILIIIIYLIADG